MKLTLQSFKNKEMQSQKATKFSSSSISTQESLSPRPNKSSKWLICGQFVHQDQLTQVYIYTDSIAFSNLSGLTILTFKNSMLFEIIEEQDDIIGFKIISDQEYVFLNQSWKDYQKWILILSKNLSRKGFYEYFALKRKIGQGAFGKVYLARQVSSMREVAVKTILKSKTENIGQIIANQILILRKISHKNIVKFQGAYETQQSYFLVFQYFANGLTLQEYLFQNRLSLSDRKQILKSLLETVDYLHSIKILHRDIKPSNILISQQTKEIKLIDFGLSVDFDQVPNYNWCGTLGYVAPQSLKGKMKYSLHNISSLDIYSVGAVYYEMVCNKRLHHGVSKQEIKLSNLTQKFNPIQFLNFIDEDEIDLLEMLIQCESEKRISLTKAKNHWFLCQNNVSTFQRWKIMELKQNKKNILQKVFKLFN